MSKVRLLVVDDHSTVRLGLRSLLDSEPDVSVVGEAVNGADAVRLYREIRPDVVLMDLHMPRLGGVRATKEIRAEFPAARILAWAISDRDEDLQLVLDAGAYSYVLKTAERMKLIAALREAANGEPTEADTKVSASALPSCN